MSDRLSFAATVTAEGRNIKGSVLLAGTQTERNGEYVRVDPAALIKADTRGLFASFEHDDGKLLGSEANGTLSLNRTEQGFDYEINNVPNTTAGNDALELIKSGEVRGSSFEITGLHSKFETDPDTGVRTRIYDRIKSLISISPVRDPAFPSMAAAFSAKEHKVTDELDPKDPQDEPDEPAAKKSKAKFAEQPKSGKDEWAAFAADLSTEQITAQMDNIFAASKGDMSGEVLDRYEGFGQVLQDRKRTEAANKARVERMETVHNLRLGRMPKAPEADDLLASDDYHNAWFGKNGYIRTGDPNVLAQFAQSIAGDGTEGGYAVPDSFLVRITETQKAYGGVQRFAENITTSDGRALPWPSNDDTANSAAIASEGSAVASGGADLVFGEISLGAYTYDATGTSNLPLAVSKELIQDAAFDIEGFVARKLGERLGRKMAADFATANGSGKPKGLFDKSADVMTATTMLAAVQEHMFQVDQAYREGGNCRWLMSDTIFAKVVQSVDGNGRPLFVPANDAGGQGGPSGFILGFPLSLDQGAASAVAFGDIKAGYIVRNVKGVTIDVDPYTLISKRQIAFHAWARADGQIQDSAAVSVSSYSGVSADS